MVEQSTLARNIGFPLLVLYGLGTILGAGIYVLIGKVAGVSGMMAPLSFLLAAVIAWVTALSYSQLVVLFPSSAGEAVYVDSAFNWRLLTIVVGVLIVFTGIVSAATLVNGFSGYFTIFIPISKNLSIVLVVLLLSAIAVWGIAESLIISGLITLIEVLGLLLIIFFCGDALTSLPDRASEIFIPSSYAQVMGIMSGAFLAFYAFIGFEDMVNVVEEVREPRRVMPKAILTVIILSTILYMLVSLVAVLSLPMSDLSASDAPLTLLIEGKVAFGVKSIAAIGVIAIVNGVLIQIIMAARVVYGMTVRYGGIKQLSFVHPVTQTPILATLLIAALVLFFALLLPLESLAKLTSFIILIVFSLVNLSLWRIKRSSTYSKLIQQRQYPLLGVFLCVSLLVLQIIYTWYL